MVHAYLMYGFPTQTVQETIDSLEMVRQLFLNGVIQSGFWHLFAMTAHSPVGLNPEAFGVIRINNEIGSFANNDLKHKDPTGCDHQQFGEGLTKAIYNYMHGIGFELPLLEWFDFQVPPTTVHPNFIESAIVNQDEKEVKDSAKVIWLGNKPTISIYEKRKKGKKYSLAKLYFDNKSQPLAIHTAVEDGEWLSNLLPQLIPSCSQGRTLGQIKSEFQSRFLTDFSEMTKKEAWKNLRKEGLLIV
jgi:hypothetical protein